MDDQDDFDRDDKKDKNKIIEIKPIAIITNPQPTKIFSRILNSIKRKPLLSLGLTAIIVTIIGGIIAIPNSVAELVKNFKLFFHHESWQPPELPKGCEQVYVTFGNAHFTKDINFLRKGGVFNIVGMNGHPVISAYLKDERFFVDANIPIQSGSLFIKDKTLINRKDLPLDWDLQSNSNALEVVEKVNGAEVPIFQIFYRKPEDVNIQFFFKAEGMIIFADNTKFVKINLPSPIPIPASDTKPIFKYPSWERPGEYAD